MEPIYDSVWEGSGVGIQNQGLKPHGPGVGGDAELPLRPPPPDGCRRAGSGKRIRFVWCPAGVIGEWMADLVLRRWT